jgi:hypothetical protein
MSLASLADETILKREKRWLCERFRDTNLALATKVSFPAEKFEWLHGNFVPAASAVPLMQTKVSSALDALARFIPTETITLYIAASTIQAAITSTLGLSAKGVYWLFAALTPILFLLVLAGKRRSTGLPPFPKLREWPWWKLVACTVAFLLWALALPTSPFWRQEEGRTLAGFGALAISIFLSLLDPIFEPQPAEK